MERDISSSMFMSFALNTLIIDFNLIDLIDSFCIAVVLNCEYSVSTGEYTYQPFVKLDFPDADKGS